MRNTALSLTALAAFTAPTIVMAQPAQAPLTGSQVIITLAKAKGVVLTPAQIVAIQRNPAAFAKSPAFTLMSKKLGLTPTLMAALVTNANAAVAPVLAVQAFVQSTTGKTLTDAAAQGFIAAHPELGTLTPQSFAAAASTRPSWRP